MQNVTSTIILLMLLASSRRLGACDMPYRALEMPPKGRTIISGIVEGFNSIALSANIFAVAPGLRVRIESVVAGTIMLGEVEVVPLYYGASCASIPLTQSELEAQYPIGSRVVAATALGRQIKASERRIVAESGLGGFVQVVPNDLVRMAPGVLHFERDTVAPSRVREVELARALTALRQARQSERFQQLLNIAHALRGRLLEQLILQNQLTTSQRLQVLAVSRRPPMAR